MLPLPLAKCCVIWLEFNRLKKHHQVFRISLTKQYLDKYKQLCLLHIHFTSNTRPLHLEWSLQPHIDKQKYVKLSIYHLTPKHFDGPTWVFTMHKKCMWTTLFLFKLIVSRMTMCKMSSFSQCHFVSLMHLKIWDLKNHVGIKYLIH